MTKNLLNLTRMGLRRNDVDSLRPCILATKAAPSP